MVFHIAIAHCPWPFSLPIKDRLEHRAYDLRQGLPILDKNNICARDLTVVYYKLRLQGEQHTCILRFDVDFYFTFYKTCGMHDLLFRGFFRLHCQKSPEGR